MPRPFDFRDKSVKETRRDLDIVLYVQHFVRAMARDSKSRLHSLPSPQNTWDSAYYQSQLAKLGYTQEEFDKLNADLEKLLFDFSRLHHDITITTNPKE